MNTATTTSNAPDTLRSSNAALGFARLTGLAAAMGLVTALALSAATPASAASFACKGKLNKAERTICKNSRLSQLDSKMSGEYFFQLGQLSGRERRQLRNDQRSWLRARNRCGRSVGCLKRKYQSRIEELVEWQL